VSPHPKLTTLDIPLGGQPVKHQHYPLFLYELCYVHNLVVLGLTVIGAMMQAKEDVAERRSMASMQLQSDRLNRRM
jgi:hypothetical protein